MKTNSFIEEITKKREACEKLHSIVVGEDTELDIFNIGSGAFFPLKGFMSSRDYRDVVENMHLECGEPWTIPITLDVRENDLDILKQEEICLKNAKGEDLAILQVEDVFKINPDKEIIKIFGVDNRKHPGILKEIGRSPFRAGGALEVFPEKLNSKAIVNLLPEETRKIFKKRGWNTITGFQTRNPIHRAHEYLQRVALEITDGLFVHPLIGWKKADDFSPQAVTQAYKMMVKLFYGEERVVLSFLRTAMRYAGPREAIFHAIIRRNYGCTHFIVGRDHAGVGNYYGKYDAHKLCNQFNDLGIKILTLKGPYYCYKCKTIVTENSCPHGDKHSLSISGTQIRSMFDKGRRPPLEYMRSEIADVLIKLQRKGELFYE